VKAVIVNADWEPREGYAVTDYENETHRATDGNKTWRNPVWSVEDVPVPQITAPDEVLLKVRAAGMCGSDVHMYETDADGYIMLAYRTRFPVVLGHEFCGEVVEVGSGVTRLRVGEAVAVEEITWCGHCRNCQRGLLNQCVNAEDYGLTLDGGFAEYVVVKERYCWSLDAIRERYDDDKAYRIGALTEPTSVAYEGLFVRAGGFQPGSPVAVFGCGPVGLAAVQLARAAGASKVIAIDTQQNRRDIAQLSGADVVLDPTALEAAGTSAAEEILAATHGEGVAMAVEASGFHQGVFPQIENSLDAWGKVVILGMDAKPAPLTTGKYQMLAGRLYGSVGHCGGPFGKTIALHAAGRIDMTSVITSQFDISDGVRAVEQTSRRVDAKVLIRPDGSVAPRA
jgi:scyllo-inosose 3-dehydrogenase